jgi:predicted HD superfamily hydrolase involved in NAD metabolism
MTYDKNSIDELRHALKAMLSEKRYAHTLGVEDMARYLAEVIIPEKIDEICVAALLHDVAKELPYDEQVDLLSSSDLAYTDEDIESRSVIHSFAAVPVIKRTFPEFATEDVLSSVANHTLGDDNMSVFDEIIYISDYAEAGRTYQTCKEVRKYLLENVAPNKTQEENLNALHQASLCSVESTIDSLEKRGEKINSRTYLTREYLQRLLKDVN